MGNLLSEDVLVPIAAFAMVVLLVAFSYKLKGARVQEQGELRKRLLDKFSSGTELTEFLATPQGQSFLKDQEEGAQAITQRADNIFYRRWYCAPAAGGCILRLDAHEASLCLPGHNPDGPGRRNADCGGNILSPV